MEMIKIQDLTLQRNEQTIFSNLNASFATSSISAIVGPNGCGKSSLLLAIAGDLKTYSGSISINGKILQDLSDREQAGLRSMALQERTFWAPMKVSEVLALGFANKSRADLARVADLLGLSGFLDKPVTNLSVGQIQRVEIARTLLQDAAIYLFDEPFSGQDLASKGVLIEIFQELRASGKVVILVVHSELEKLSWCDQILDLTS
jgi:ABC-type Mn2+/Zn2+ transport system ATPase subunit